MWFKPTEVEEIEEFKIVLRTYYGIVLKVMFFLLIGLKKYIKWYNNNYEILLLNFIIKRNLNGGDKVNNKGLEIKDLTFKYGNKTILDNIFI